MFCEFFLRALESGKADGEAALAGGAKDGVTTLLEAFNWASHQTGQWISRQREDEEHNWVVTGKESVAIFKKLFDGADGEIGARKLSGESDANAEDPILALATPTDGETAHAWAHRRVINEHAILEDAGKENGVAALSNAKGYEPVPLGKSGDQGNLASRTVLGQSSLRNAEKRP